MVVDDPDELVNPACIHRTPIPAGNIVRRLPCLSCPEALEQRCTGPEGDGFWHTSFGCEGPSQEPITRPRPCQGHGGGSVPNHMAGMLHNAV